MKHKYTAKVSWVADSTKFIDGKYSRSHKWEFDGGIEVIASSSPAVVPVPYSVEQAVDPEEAFVASLSSCHMLWFLSIAAGKGFSVASYVDNAYGIMGKNPEGKIAILCVTLQPRVEFSGAVIPTNDVLELMHHTAHEECFIASSVRSEVICKPVY
ncbi:MAG TPA: OsmC family protein [Cellvibrio sp.]|nr:OsmC family protein [Cellvibrio sp.]